MILVIVSSLVVSETQFLVWLSLLVPPSVFVEKDLVVAKAGEAISLQCTANGRPQPVIQWYKEQNLLQRTRKIAISSTGLLVINAADQNDTGFYTCLASNNVGSDSATVTVSVQSKFG